MLTRSLLLIGLALIYCGTYFYALAKEYVYSDAAVKSAYILNIIDFVEFPDSTQKLNKICIFGDDIIGLHLADLIQKKRRPNPLQIVRVSENSSLVSCKVLFLSSTVRDYEGKVLYKTESFPVLTIGDSVSFNERGGIIEFSVIDGKIRFNINLSSAKAKGLRINSELLEIAKEIYEPRK